MDTRAFVYPIDPIGSGDLEDNAVHQVSPAWVLTFVRFGVRDTLRSTGAGIAVRKPLVVENDCIQIATSMTKGTLTPSMQATLMLTNVNYETSVNPGDFVMVNILNSPKEARRVADLARAEKPINGIDDGFKGIFKVQGVRRIVNSDVNNGNKVAAVRITGFAFTEFNNTIYFNPYLLNGEDKENELLFATFLGDQWQKLINAKGITACQDIIRVLIDCFIGSGIRQEGIKQPVQNQTTHFLVPPLVGQLLNAPGATAARDIYEYVFGLQRYRGANAPSVEEGLNPSALREMGGHSQLRAEYWNNVKTWAILNQYTNSPLNELFTRFSVNSNGDVMPTVIFRQIPFTNEDYTGGGDTTRFMTLPRWKIDSSLIIEQDIGKDEAARINFVQFFGKSAISSDGSDISYEIAQGNYVYDVKDVQRSGMRPFIVTTNFDDNTNTYKEYQSPIWARIIADSVIGGHLKMNGSITCAGIVDPITVGDNLELDNVVYHIESVAHSATVNPGSGNTIFRTTIALSSGMHISSSVKGARYAEMDHTSAHNKRTDDWYNDEILPGVGGSQDTVAEQEFLNKDGTGNDAPFEQPGVGIKPVKTKKPKQVKK